MDRCRRKRPKTATSDSDEVISNEWEFISMTEQEEDLLCRMYRLVGPSYCKTRYLNQLCFKSRETIPHEFYSLNLEMWDLIAGRIPGRKPEELERFWIMRHCDTFADKRNQQTKDNSEKCWSSNV